MEASLRNLETQVGQLAHQLSERIYDNLPTKRNLREEVNAITSRNERELEEVEKEPRETVKKDKKVMDETPKRDESELSKSIPKVKAYKPKVLFPSKLMQHNLDKQFSKFLEVFKKLHINIPFADALGQMPSYAKFLKEILKNKRKLEDFEIVELNEECSAILLNKLPQKLKNPRSFTTPCTIGSISFDKALCDLGASINLMSLSILQKLGLKEPTPSNVTLQLVDSSIAIS